MSGLSEHARAVLAEEEALLAQVRAALAAATARPAAADLGAAREAWRSLREQAGETSDDDLPTVLSDLSVQQRLAARVQRGPIPDARAPYVAHLRVREGERSRDYLLGHLSFLTREVRIVDWRVAPVAQIFYRYREGDDYEEAFPGRVAEGVVEARRIVVFEHGELARIIAGDLVLVRRNGVWEAGDPLALAVGGAGSAARPGVLGVGIGAADRAPSAEITALLDAEQFAAVSAPADDPLLVLGSAGSGKTTVALHRLARICALDGYPIGGVRVVVPEEGLARLSRRLLAPLGAGAAQVQTLDAWSADLSRRVFGRTFKLSDDAPAAVLGLKRHPSLYRALQAKLSKGPASAGHLRRRLAELLSDRAFLSGVVDDAGGELPRHAVEETVRHTMLQVADTMDRQLASIPDEERKTAIDGRSLVEGTPDELAGTVDAEDLPILLAMRAWREGLGQPAYAHLVLDEAEDFSLFELYVLAQLLGDRRSVTLAGDEAQQTASSFAGWQTSLDTLGAHGAATVRLAVSYRCPQPVVDLARHLLGGQAPPSPAQAARNGAPLGVFPFPTEAQAQLFVAGALQDLIEREPHAAIAVIAHDAETARRFYDRVEHVPEARLVLDGGFSFDAGVDVTTVDDAKGLEWDYVIVPDATADAYRDDAEARRRLHVAVTRTSHQLWLVAAGRPTSLLP